MEEYIFDIDNTIRVKIDNIQRIPQIKKNRKPNTGHDRKLNLRDCNAQRISKGIPDIT